MSQVSCHFLAAQHKRRLEIRGVRPLSIFHSTVVMVNMFIVHRTTMLQKMSLLQFSLDQTTIT